MYAGSTHRTFHNFDILIKHCTEKIGDEGEERIVLPNIAEEKIFAKRPARYVLVTHTLGETLVRTLSRAIELISLN